MVFLALAPRISELRFPGPATSDGVWFHDTASAPPAPRSHWVPGPRARRPRRRRAHYFWKSFRCEIGSATWPGRRKFALAPAKPRCIAAKSRL